jgi:hypothetical protein
MARPRFNELVLTAAIFSLLLVTVRAGGGSCNQACTTCNNNVERCNTNYTTPSLCARIGRFYQAPTCSSTFELSCCRTGSGTLDCCRELCALCAFGSLSFLWVASWKYSWKYSLVLTSGSEIHGGGGATFPGGQRRWCLGWRAGSSVLLFQGLISSVLTPCRRAHPRPASHLQCPLHHSLLLHCYSNCLQRIKPGLCQPEDWSRPVQRHLHPCGPDAEMPHKLCHQHLQRTRRQLGRSESPLRRLVLPACV